MRKVKSQRSQQSELSSFMANKNFEQSNSIELLTYLFGDFENLPEDEKIIIYTHGPQCEEDKSSYCGVATKRLLLKIQDTEIDWICSLTPGKIIDEEQGGGIKWCDYTYGITALQTGEFPYPVNSKQAPSFANIPAYNDTESIYSFFVKIPVLSKNMSRRQLLKNAKKTFLRKNKVKEEGIVDHFTIPTSQLSNIMKVKNHRGKYMFWGISF